MLHRRTGNSGWIVLVLLILGVAAPARAADPSAEGVEFFEKRIRPLLADNCFRCHSRDTKQKAHLRLDSRTAMLKGGDNGPALKPGEPDNSLIIKAVRFTGAIKMPKNSKMSDEAIADLTAWVKMGAPWPGGDDKDATTNSPKEFDLKERAKHWAFQPLKPGGPPAVKNTDWPRNTIDRYILAKLEAKSLSPAGPADERTLLRRVTFDLTGLPPTPAEIDAFLADDSPEAYERVVNRLLDSPHYGERWARHWLDLVRYAETYGHEYDFEMPEAYEYRDYVIRAFNSDLPYDQFVTEHVAGDLLPKPRRHPKDRFNESILGTGFWHLGEAAHSPVDVRQNQADHLDNQIDVFGKTFLGLTIACARCHDHKFDAIASKDYYALAGYLESSRYQRAFIDAPEPTREIIKRLGEVKADAQPLAVAASARTLLSHLDALPDAAKADPLLKPYLELAHADEKQFAAKRKELAEKLKGEGDRATAVASKAIHFDEFAKSSYADWFITGESFGYAPSRIGDVTLRTDGGLPVQRVFRAGVAHSGLVSNKLQGALRSRTFRIEKDHVLYHVAGRDVRVNLIIDGYQLIRDPIYGGLTFTVNHGDSFAWAAQNVSMWKGHNAYVEFLDDGDGWIALEQILFADSGTPAEAPNRLLVGLLDDPAADTQAKYKEKLQALLRRIVDEWRADQVGNAIDAADRIAVLNALLTSEWPHGTSTPTAERERLKVLQARYREIEATIPKPRRAMAMTEGTGVNEHIFIRGSHKNLGPEAPRRFLEAIAGPNQAAPAQGSGRLELAKRMVDGTDPLLPRVMVNRLWQHHFGEGIVASTDNFGVLGQLPTHPELLDFLASEFIRQGWSIKKMHRLMVLSNTYRMASRSEAKAEESDPQNKLLHRMPVRRLEAECIRDSILAVSGRLDDQMFGPSVPPHLTPFMQGRGRPSSSGPLDGDGRRSIYLGVRRNFLNPMFLAFDYPIPFTAIGHRSVSNVPAQALTMMNNPFVVGEAQRWAKSVLAEKDLTAVARVEKMHVAAFGRPPSEEELKESLTFLEEQRKEYGKIDDPRAWSDLCHVLLNVKEFIFVN
jgi:cytochrome c553